MEQRQHEAQPVAFPQLTETVEEQRDGSVIPWEVLATLELPVHVELGRVEVTVQELLELTPAASLNLTRLSVNLLRFMSQANSLLAAKLSSSWAKNLASE